MFRSLVSTFRICSNPLATFNHFFSAGWVLVLLLHGPTLFTWAAPLPDRTDDQRLEKAHVKSKYGMLLRQFKVAKDSQTYGLLRELGYRTRTSYAGHTNLPEGWWVYVHPYWYIWRDHTAVRRNKRNWGPEQATGAPNTNAAGDRVTAWASRSADGQDEWLMVEFDKMMVPTAVVVHETYNPGALVRVTAFKSDGSEVEVWKGVDPTPVGAGKGLSKIPIKITFKTRRIKLYIASSKVAGWNEIDAVGLVDKAKKVHWAARASASTTYAPPHPKTDMRAVMQEQRMTQLEDEVRQLRKELNELKKLLRDMKK